MKHNTKSVRGIVLSLIPLAQDFLNPAGSHLPELLPAECSISDAMHDTSCMLRLHVDVNTSPLHIMVLAAHYTFINAIHSTFQISKCLHS